MLVKNDQVGQVINQSSFFVGNRSLVFHGTEFPRHNHAFVTRSMSVPSVLPNLFEVLHIFYHDCFAESFL